MKTNEQGSYYVLQNPRQNLSKASISTFYIDGKQYASIYIQWSGNNGRDLGYSFNGLVAAKRYFGKEYQSKKHGYETPIWKET